MHVSGSDIGCGIAIFRAGRLNISSVLTHVKSEHDQCHFAEVMSFDEVFDAASLQRIDIDQHDMVLCVHSGSRQLGRHIYDEFGSQSIT